MKSILKEKSNAGSYSRLSRDDGDKNESDSIRNQKELIRNFLKNHPDIELIEDYVDDGYSGANFDRPDFKRMIEDIKSKKIDCVIVKDLSRFGRNYIETGKYIEKIFPFLGVRFISINDNYDSSAARQQSDSIILPFKNLINDMYCRDISVKIRSNLNAKRRRGDFVGAFAPYGYKKSSGNKNQLVIDPTAANVVKRIFQMKLEGKSNGKIADILNAEHIPAPYDYKRHTEQGKNFKPSFYYGSNVSWCVPTIIRILENEIYIGNLVQGKSGRPNYKVKGQLSFARTEWVRVENTHEAIIDKIDYELVQKLLTLDTRIAPGNTEVYLFSGILVCGKCGETLIRRMISCSGEKYVYYGCYDKKRTLKCKGVSIRESVIEEVILKAIQKHIELLVEMDAVLKFIDERSMQKAEIVYLDNQIDDLNTELVKYQRLKSLLYSDYHAEILDYDEYLDLKVMYKTQEKKLNCSIEELLSKKKKIVEGKSGWQRCMKLFLQFRNIQQLDRKILVSLVSRIKVFSNRDIEICFSYQDEFNEMCSAIEKIK